MNLVPGQIVRWPSHEGPLYRVRSVEESLVESEIPGTPQVFTSAVLRSLNGHHEIRIHVVNPDNLQILEDAPT